MRHKLICFLLIAIIGHTLSVAQESEKKDLFNHDISVNLGFYPSLITNDFSTNLNGSIQSLDYAFFFYNRLGFRTGFSSITSLEGTKNVYNIPILLAYRSKAHREFSLGSHIDSFSDLIFQVILGLIPKHAEYNIGFNLGYIEPDNNLGLVSYNNGPYFKEGYLTNSRFMASADVGLRLTYRIYNFGIVLSPSVSYLMTKNLEFYSEQSLNNGFSPDWFMRFTIGLSYRF